jgi:hypothetical protein
MSQLAALGLTIAVELPWYVLGLAGLRLTSAWRAALLGVGVNLVTHPVLWWMLAPRPTLTRLTLAELAVGAVEALLLFIWVRREPALLVVLSIGANATSVLIGVALT